MDSKEEPENIEVYIFPADEVRQRFDAAYAARVKAELVVRDDFGMWVNLDLDKRDVHAAVGSGIIEKYKPVAVFSIAKLLAEKATDLPVEHNEDADEFEKRFAEDGTLTGRKEDAPEPRFTTIAQVMAWAREQVANIAGVKVEAVKLDLKLEY